MLSATTSKSGDILLVLVLEGEATGEVVDKDNSVHMRLLHRVTGVGATTQAVVITALRRGSHATNVVVEIIFSQSVVQLGPLAN